MSLKVKIGAAAKPSGAAGKITKIENELNRAFQERDHLARGIVLALLTRQHVLVYGGKGTAKSKLVTALFSALEGKVFATQFGEGITEDFVIGPPNVALLQKEGRIEHNVKGFLPEAEFAYLEELFDANGGLLRGTLLTLLNERKFMRGTQHFDVPLWTAVATTNFYKDNDDKLDAVIDRFLVRIKVTDLQEDSSVETMLCNYVEGVETTFPTITRDELAALHVKMQAVDIELSLIQLYQALLADVAKLSGSSIRLSDRRKCQVLDLMRASAVLAGRTECNDDDLEAARYGVVNVGDDTQDAYFDGALVSAKASYAAMREHSEVDGVVKQSLERIGKVFASNRTDGKKITTAFGNLDMVSKAIEAQINSGKLSSKMMDKFKGYAKTAKELSEEMTKAFEAVNKK